MKSFAGGALVLLVASYGHDAAAHSTLPYGQKDAASQATAAFPEDAHIRPASRGLFGQLLTPDTGLMPFNARLMRTILIRDSGLARLRSPDILRARARSGPRRLAAEAGGLRTWG
jgi:hypothetical protein